MRKGFITLLLVISFPVFPEDSSDSYAGKLVRLLELTASSVNNTNRGPETIGSLLNSTRLANSLTSNSGEIFKEINRSNEASASSKIKYSHQFADIFFASISYTNSARLHYERTTLGSQSAVIYDNVNSTMNQTRFNIGFGPLDYLSDLSFELSFGYETGSQSGPFMTNGIRFPRVADRQAQPGNIFLGTGSILFNYKAYSINMGVSGLWNWFGIYYLMDMQYINSSLSLSSIGYDTKESSLTTKNQFTLTLNPHLQYAYLRFPSMDGMLINMETGFIIKFFENLGIKIGGYYQFAFIDHNQAKGFYYNNSTLNEATSNVSLSSASKRNNTGFWGGNFGVITRF